MIPIPQYTDIWQYEGVVACRSACDWDQDEIKRSMVPFRS